MDPKPYGTVGCRNNFVPVVFSPTDWTGNNRNEASKGVARLDAT